jgi:plasmid stability protein
MTSKNRETVERVEFRWRQHDEGFAERLEESARAAGHSTSDHARELLKDALTRSEQLQHDIHTLQQEVAQLHSQLRELAKIKDGIRLIHENIYRLRDDLATSVTRLLTDAGRLEAETAEQWVQETLTAE